MKTKHFLTKQEGYGRQGLYFCFNDKNFYLQSVFPNVEEHYNALYYEYCFFDEENDVYTDGNGRPVTPVEDWDKFLFEQNKELIGEVLYENREDLEDYGYGYDFDGNSYEEIAEWAFNL